jgi:membrane protein CcdC involved in cytochrome C biogenesis
MPPTIVVIVSSMWWQIWGRDSQICVEEYLCLIPLFLSQGALGFVAPVFPMRNPMS